MPGITETWIELASAEQIEALEKDRIDLGFARTPLEHPGLSSIVIAEHGFLVALPADHQAAGAKKLKLSSLASETFVLSPRETASGFHDVVIATCHARDSAPASATAHGIFLPSSTWSASAPGSHLFPSSWRS